MPAVRYYFQSTGTPDITPAFDAQWEQTGQAVRLPLVRASLLTDITALTNFTVTVPITTTQNILAGQFISTPIITVQRAWWPSVPSDAIRLIVRCLESANAANAHLCYSVRVVSFDGGTVRGTIDSNQASATEMSTAAQTRTRATNIASTALMIQAGDRLVVEVGILAASPTSAQTATLRFGTSGGTDFAFAQSLTTDLNPWIEIEQTGATPFNNYHSVRSSGLSTSGAAR